MRFSQGVFIKRTLTMAVAAVAAFSATNVAAASFNFSYTFDGTDITQDVGSDTATGTTLEVGDTFTSTIAAAGDDFFRVDGPYNDVFVPMSYLPGDSATRTADISASFFLDGAEVASIIDMSESQSFVHVGAQNWTLAAGLEFDTVVLDWSFLAIDDANVDTVIADVDDFFEGFGLDDSPFFTSPNISYVAGDMAPIPLPAGLPLLAVGLLGFGVMARRKA